MRYDTKQPIAGSGPVGDSASLDGNGPSISTGDDVIAERRRAKAIKVCRLKKYVGSL